MPHALEECSQSAGGLSRCAARHHLARYGIGIAVKKGTEGVMERAVAFAQNALRVPRYSVM